MVQAYLTISFDDGFKETFESTISCLCDRGLNGSYNVITSLVGSTYLNLPLASWADWQYALTKGMEIGSHSVNHCVPVVPLSHNLRVLADSFLHELNRFSYLKHVAQSIFITPHYRGYGAPKMKSDRIPHEVKGSKEEICRRLGREARSYVYPGGTYTRAYQACVEAEGYSSARSLVRGFNRLDAPSLLALKCMPWIRYTTVETANKWIDAVIQRNGWLIEVYHLVAPHKPAIYHSEFTSVDDFKSHLDYICNLRDRGKLRVDTQENVATRICQRNLWKTTV
jgi:hypothetical protein